MPLSRPSLLLRWTLSLLLLASAALHASQMLYIDSLTGWAHQAPETAHEILDNSASWLTWPAVDAQIEMQKRGDRTGLTDAHLNRIALAPADAYAWNRLAVDLHLQGKLNERTQRAVEMALVLAPHSRSIAITQSIIAAYNWDNASPELRQTWLAAFETAALAHHPLVYDANQAGVGEKLCAVMPTEFRPNEYCRIRPAMVKVCARPTLSPRQLRFCLNTGMRSIQ